MCTLSRVWATFVTSSLFCTHILYYRLIFPSTFHLFACSWPLYDSVWSANLAENNGDFIAGFRVACARAPGLPFTSEHYHVTHWRIDYRDRVIPLWLSLGMSDSARKRRKERIREGVLQEHLVSGGGLCSHGADCCSASQRFVFRDVGVCFVGRETPYPY
jgi:hypothetical protein